MYAENGSPIYIVSIKTQLPTKIEHEPVHLLCEEYKAKAFENENTHALL